MDEKILKILFVSNDKFPPFRVDVAVLFAKKMKSKGHQIDWILQSKQTCYKAYRSKWLGGEAWVGPTNNGTGIFSRLLKHLYAFIHNCRCAILLLKGGYDIIQVKDHFVTAIIYGILSRTVGIKFFYWISYPFPEASLYLYEKGKARYPLIYLIRGNFYKFLLYRIIMKLADHNFVQSEKMKDDIASCGILKKNMTSIPMGIDLTEFDNINDDFKEDSHTTGKTIAYLGTLNRIRRIDFLIRVLYLVVKEIPDVMLYLIGQSDEINEIERLKGEAYKHGILDKVVFTGFMERKKAFALIKTVELCVSPYYPTPVLNSTSPTKLIEYMALGKAVVANNHPEQQLVLKKSGGGICVPYNEKEFSKAIAFLLKHKDITIKMGKSGKKWVRENRTYDIIANRVEQAYRNKLIE